MEAKEFFRERTRMIDSIRGVQHKGENSCAGLGCCDCPLAAGGICIANTEEGVDIVEKWSEEHPIKTIKQDFLEKYPNAKKNQDGSPRFCPEQLGYEVNCDDGCRKCWNTPMEVE